MKYLKWFRKEYMSSTNNCVDIGKTTTRSIFDFERNNTLISTLNQDTYSGNGSIMHLTPIPIPILYHNKSINYCTKKSW